MQQTGSKRVLLVDDNPYFRKAAGSFVSSIPGLELVGEAMSGEQALELAGTLHPDLILMDFSMRGMNGIAATIAIKRQPDPPKIVIITAHSQAEFRLLSETAGADGFLLKDELVKKLPPLLGTLFPPESTSDNDHTGSG